MAQSLRRSPQGESLSEPKPHGSLMEVGEISSPGEHLRGQSEKLEGAVWGAELSRVTIVSSLTHYV